MLPSWLAEAYARQKLLFGTTGIRVKTSDGESVAGYYDWVVRDVEGDIVPVKASAFDACYEPAEETTHG